MCSSFWLWSVGTDPFLGQILEGILLNVPTAQLLLNIGENLWKGRLHATVIVSYNDMNVTGVACLLEAYFIEQVSELAGEPRERFSRLGTGKADCDREDRFARRRSGDFE